MRRKLLAIAFTAAVILPVNAYAVGRGANHVPLVLADAGMSNQPAGSYEPDQDRALRARQEGKALPLATIIERQGLVGRVVAVRLTSDGGRLIYELSVLDSNGQERIRRFDASTGDGI